MILFFAKDKVADEVTGVVGVYHRALFGAETCLWRAFASVYYLLFFIKLIC